MKNYLKIFLLLCFLLLTQNLFSQHHKKREMRGVWIATVSNIDWPLRQDLTSEEQRRDLITILNQLAENNINTIIIQIRPTADALYFSKIEPWSHWLSGTQGNEPVPYYDPLEFIIDEAHKRFIDVHVWLNPYRVTVSENLSILDKNHLFNKERDLFLKYGKRYFFNPGLDKTRKHLNKVVKDIVERYDIDAIHFDDYFYPYPEKKLDFNDNETFAKNPRGFSPSQIADWRRNNVNLIISELQLTIKNTKPWVEFGISPFGVWRNNSEDPRGSATKGGVQNYDDLYADILKWLEQGDIDYVTPQLYWEIGKKNVDYKVLAEWWNKNVYSSNLYAGLAAYKLCDNSQAKAWNQGNELIRQLDENKKHPKIKGVMYFSAKGFLQNKCGLNDLLQETYYKHPALPPINNNIKGTPAEAPSNIKVNKTKNNITLTWDKTRKKGGEKPSHYILYAFKGKKIGDFNDPSNILLFTRENEVDLRNLPNGEKLKGNYTFVLTTLNRYKYESIPNCLITIKM